METLSILHYPDTQLRLKAKPVDNIDDSIRTILDQMLATMYDAPGVGLAAPQVNIQKQLLVIDISENKDDPLYLINPTIQSKTGTQICEEGCLSVPNVYADIPRAKEIIVTALDYHGQALELTTDGLLAVCIQHEIDHLEGKLFVDYLSKMKQQRIRKKMLKMDKNAQMA